ncbi:MAG TPA: CsgG/HfaB family protein [Ignavibacteriaceae bacterium]|nr:CsgG/HfaB family protein [Ignavibacteriaceae bacterium]
MFRKFNYIFILLLCITAVSFAQSSKEKLESAQEYYKAAQFDDAINVLNEIASDNSTDTETKKEALRYLGRSYTAKGLYDEAKGSIKKLLELEPPVVEFNPDYEPPVFMKLYYESRKEFSDSYEVERPDPGTKTMAIIDFKNRSIDKKLQYDPMEQGFADLLISRLNNSTGLKVVERERIKWILDEMKLQENYDMEGAVRVGKLLGAQTVLLGSFIVANDEIWLGGRLVKVETSEILLTDEIKGDLDQFFDLVDQLSEKISEKINVTLKDDKISEVSEGPSLDAILAYSIGLNFLEKEDYQSAYAKFQEALKFSPDYDKAKLKAESIEPYL